MWPRSMPCEAVVEERLVEEGDATLFDGENALGCHHLDLLVEVVDDRLWLSQLLPIVHPPDETLDDRQPCVRAAAGEPARRSFRVPVPVAELGERTHGLDVAHPAQRKIDVQREMQRYGQQPHELSRKRGRKPGLGKGLPDLLIVEVADGDYCGVVVVRDRSQCSVVVDVELAARQQYAEARVAAGFSQQVGDEGQAFRVAAGRDADSVQLVDDHQRVAACHDASEHRRWRVRRFELGPELGRGRRVG